MTENTIRMCHCLANVYGVCYAGQCHGPILLEEVTCGEMELAQAFYDVVMESEIVPKRESVPMGRNVELGCRCVANVNGTCCATECHGPLYTMDDLLASFLLVSAFYEIAATDKGGTENA